MGLGLSGLRLGLAQQLWGTVWSPANLFPTGTEEGLFLDLSDISTLYTDQTFATNISSIGDPVGGVLDKSQGGGLGGEEVINGDFSSSTNWTLNANVAITGGSLVFTSAASFNAASQSIAGVAVGDFVEVSYDIVITSGAVSVSLGNFAEGQHSVSGHRVFRGVVTVHNSLRLEARNGPASFTVDNVSVRKLPGNHLIQSTAAARPIWTRHPKSGVRNLYNAGTITGGGDMVVAVDIADPVGGTSAFTLEAQSTSDDYFYASLPAGASLTNSVWLRRRSGSGTISMHTPGNIAQAVAVTSDWTRFSVSGSSPSGGASSAFIGVRIATLGDQVDVFGFQHETGSTATAYQTRVSQYDVTEAGVDDCYGLTFDGIDDYMVTAANLDLSGDDQVFTCMGADMTDVATTAWALDTYTAVSTPSFTIKAPMSDGVSSVNATSSGDGTRVATAGQSVSAPFVLSAWSDISAPSVIDRLDGASGTAVTDSQGTGNQSSGTLTLAARNSDKTLFFTGTIYGVTLTDYTLDAEQLAALETWTAARTPEVTLAVPPVLSNFTDNLDQDPPNALFDSTEAGTLTWDFDASATPPSKGAGSIGTGTDSVTSGANDIDIDLSAYPGETGYLHLRVANAAGDSNVLTSQEITVPAPAEIIVNGGFDDTSGWTLGANTSISGGVLNAGPSAGPCINSGGPIVAATTYDCAMTVVATSGDCRLNVGDASGPDLTTGTHTFQITTSNTLAARLQFGAGFQGTVDNVSVQVA